ncbi:MAG: T9SS type A sorting domain-containing protein [Ferruginibacter sp.]
MKKNHALFLTIILVSFLSVGGTSCFQKIKNDSNTTKEKDEYDGPDKAAELAYRKTMNPTTGRVDRQKLWEAILQTQQMKQQYLNTPSTITGLSWTERGSYTDAAGPSNGNLRPGNGVTSGRIRAIWADLSDATGKTVWTAGVDGGLWKTTDITASTPTWNLVNDYLSNLSISGICQDPTNTNTMYFCTGESFFNADAVFGNGVFKSTDHGVTWNQLTSTTTLNRCSKILCDALGNIYVSTIGISIAVGLQRSSDGGNTWTSINPFSTTSRIVDFEISSTGTMHVSAGLSSAVGIGGYRFNTNPSTATTLNWSAATTLFAFPAGSNTRTELACAGNTVYAALGNTSSKIDAIAKSTDGGANWTTTALTTTNIADLNGSGQAWYSIGLGVDPSNANNVMVGSLNTLKSIDGGITFSKISEWVGSAGQYVHADIHNITWYDGGNKCLIGCDGGLFYTANGGTNFSDKNTGLRLKQFYSVAIHPTLTNYFLAGAQDNGTHQINAAGLASSVEVTGGDGAYVDIDQDQPQYQFGAYVYNQYKRSTNGGASWSAVNFSSSAGEFINPFDFDDVGNKMYCCYDAGTYLRWEDPQTGSTSTTISLPTFGGTSYAEAITVSPYTANRVYFGTDDGKIIKVDNANAATPTDVIITPPGMTGFVNGIAVGTSDQNLIATIASTGVNNVWFTNDGGATWSACDGNLPDLPVYSAVLHPDNNNKAYIATEAGVFYTDQLSGAATLWIPETTFPTVKTEMLRYRASDRTLAAATHGRGLWTATIPSGCTSAGIATQPSDATVCPSANATFSIAGTGTAFQWQESTNGGSIWNNITNGGVYSGATTITLALTGVTVSMNTYKYRCVVTGTCAPLTINSNAVTLFLNTPITITSQPITSTICANASSSFSVAATGTAVTYQWQVSTNGGASFTNLTNGTPYTNVTTSTLIITAAPVSLNNYQYRCVVGGACTPVNSNAVILTVNAAPAIVTPPTSSTICAGNTVNFSVGASGTSLTYQWQLSTNAGVTFNNILGAITSTYSFVATLSQNNFQYRCVVSGTCTPSAISTAAILSVGSSLVINSQPIGATVCQTFNTSFSVAVSGTVSYQWQVSTNGGALYNDITNGGIYSNATTATLDLSSVPVNANNNLYRCTVSGSCPTINSSSALLRVNTLPLITTEPTSSAVLCASQNTSFTIAAIGTGINYQWQVSTNGGIIFSNLTNGGVYSNVTTPTLSITGALTAMNTFQYRCKVNGTCPTYDSSNIATLSVYTPIAISANPSGTTVCENSNASFNIVASGTSPIYQWQESSNGGVSFTNIINGGVYSGATAATLNLAGVGFSLNNVQYRCIVNGAAPCGSVNSGTATLIVNPAPGQVTLNGGGAYCVGANGVAVGLANSSIGINYQLLLNGVNSGLAVPGTGVALSFGNKTTAGNYSIIASNAITGCTQSMIGTTTILINPLPTITLNAAPYISLYPGLTTTLTATATSSATPISYFWFKNNAPISNSGSTLSVNITGVGDYRVAVTDGNGCSNQSQVVNISDSANGKLFIYPSPNNGQFNITYYNKGGESVKRIVTIYSNKGDKVYSNQFQVTQVYQLLNIDMRRNSTGVYYIVLSDANGNKLKSGQVLVR